MAKLTNCKDCGHQISKNATQCPNCGARIKKTSMLTWFFAVLFGLPFLFAIFKSANTSTQPTPKPVAQEVTSGVEQEKFNPNMEEIRSDPNYKKTKTMDFQTCLKLQEVYTQQLGKNNKVVEVEKTDTLSSVKYCANDGSTTVTCDGKNNKMTLAKTDKKGC